MSQLKPSPTVVLETSAAIAYLADEPEYAAIEKLLELAEGGKVQVLISDFAWREIDKGDHPTERVDRLRNVTSRIPPVFRWGSGRWGYDMWGHDSSTEILIKLPISASNNDREQFLSYAAYAAAMKAGFFVTKDNDFLKHSAKTQVHEPFGFRVGRPQECISWLKEVGII